MPPTSYQTIGQLLTRQAIDHTARVYVMMGEARWTYAAAEQQATALATGLLNLGLRPGDRLALILPNRPEFVLAVFAAAKAGLILTPINVRRRSAEVLARLQKTQPAALITDGEHLPMIHELRAQLPDLAHLIALGRQEGALAWSALVAEGARSLGETLPEVKADDLAAILFTLGNSGQPRGVMLTHSALLHNAANIASALACTPEDVFLGAVPFSNSFGLAPTILATAIAGAQLAPLPHYHPGEALALIERARATIHHGVPTMFALELNHPDFAPERCASLRTGIMSGAACPPELVGRVREKMHCNVRLGYGLTEAAPGVTLTRADDGPITATQTVGSAMPEIELKTIEPDGELCVRGPNLMRGYWLDPEATAQALDAEGWLHTGDLAVIDADGPVRIVGRKGEVINRGGFKIYPGTVEMTLRLHPSVKEAAVVGVPDAIFGEAICACVVRAPGTNASADELRAFATGHLTDSAAPDRVVFFDVLPRRGSGPVLKDMLRERVRIRGKAWTFGKNIDTDAIIPARHCNTADPRELAQHCMEDADPAFVKQMRRGDVIVADTNFGCGSSREVAPISIKAAGVSAVIAKSFARIFFRNAINIGLPILECAPAVDAIAPGDEIEVEPATGLIHNLTRHETYHAEPFPDFLQSIINRGGLLGYVEERLAEMNHAR